MLRALLIARWDVWDARDAWDNGFRKLPKRKAKPESQALLSIGASVDRLRRFSEWIGSTTSAGGERSISQVAGDFEGGGIVQAPQMCVDMVTGGIPP